VLGRCAWWGQTRLLDVVINEGPLRRVVGDWDVRGRQLTRLAQANALPNVALRGCFAAAAHSGGWVVSVLKIF
jgi:hypothetical protein